jgi:lipoate synthase
VATIIPERRPVWLKVRPPQGENYEHLKQLMRSSYHAREQADESIAQGPGSPFAEGER